MFVIACFDHLFVIASRMNIPEGAPVVKWLQDLRLTTESECMSILQGKSVAKETLSMDSKVLRTKKLKGTSAVYFHVTDVSVPIHF